MARIDDPETWENQAERGRNRGQELNDAHDRQARLTARDGRKKISKYLLPQKQEKYRRDLEKLKSEPANSRGEIDYSILGNKQLSANAPGELTRDRGYFLKTRKVIRLNEETGKAYIAVHETAGLTKRTRYTFDENNEMLSKHVVRRDGRFEEKWERDGNKNLIRTKYFNSLMRDFRDMRPISEEMSEQKVGKDGKLYYSKLTRKKGHKKEVFERDANGNLDVAYRKTPMSSYRKRRSLDGSFAEMKTQRLGGLLNSSSTILLDKNGKSIGQVGTSDRTLMNKRSTTYNQDTGRWESKRTLGKFYRSKTEFNESTKRISKKIFGLKLSTKIRELSDSERSATKRLNGRLVEYAQTWDVTPDNLSLKHSPPPVGRQVTFASDATTVFGQPGKSNTFSTAAFGSPLSQQVSPISSSASPEQITSSTLDAPFSAPQQVPQQNARLEEPFSTPQQVQQFSPGSQQNSAFGKPLAAQPPFASSPWGNNSKVPPANAQAFAPVAAQQQNSRPSASGPSKDLQGLFSTAPSAAGKQQTAPGAARENTPVERAESQRSASSSASKPDLQALFGTPTPEDLAKAKETKSPPMREPPPNARQQAEILASLGIPLSAASPVAPQTPAIDANTRQSRGEIDKSGRVYEPRPRAGNLSR